MQLVTGRDPDWQDRLGFRGRQDVESPYGEWTRLEVVADGDRVDQRGQRKVVNEGYRATPTEGRIIIQSEGGRGLLPADRIWSRLPVRLTGGGGHG